MKGLTGGTNATWRTDEGAPRCLGTAVLWVRRGGRRRVWDYAQVQTGEQAQLVHWQLFAQSQDVHWQFDEPLQVVHWQVLAALVFADVDMGMLRVG